MSASLSPTPARPGLLDRVRAVRQEHFRETGRSLAWDDAVAELDRREGEYGAVPVPRDLAPVAHHLASLGYTDLAIAGALGDIRRLGSAWASSWVDECDLAEVERLVPGVNAWQWDASTDLHTYGLGAEG